MNEAETRQQLIDEKLHMAGWNVADPSQVVQELDIDLSLTGATRVAEPPTTPYGGHQFADYALVHHGRPVAVVEAKRTSKNADLGLEQAVQYAKNLQQIHGGMMPFVFTTNGYEIQMWEHGFYPPTKVHGFPTRLDLEWMDLRRTQRKPLSVELINTEIAGRDYQIAAIRSVLEGIEAKRRRFLLVMATGTGKTRVATALIDVLSRAKWAKRVLFLVDRIALRDQALDAFKEHIPSEPAWPKKDDEGFPRDRRLYVATYPTMLNLIEAGTSPGTWLSPHFFDVVIADESHRSIYNVYKQVLDYLTAIKVGLTATPTAFIDHDTFGLFDCQSLHPTFAYNYSEAVEHQPPYLCDFEVLKVRSKFQLEGIHGGLLPDAVQKQLVAEGKDIEDIDFEGTDLERKVTNSGTNAVIVREFMENCIKDPTGTLPGKTIFFAISKGHAKRLKEMFDALYPEHGGTLARVLVSEDRFVHGKGGLLDQFKKDDMPRVAISVDMLDTGVDVREVVNLVFAKPVFSYTKFWQMIGRGTRVLDTNPAKRKKWCPEKDKFLIIDCWANFDFFKMQPKGKEPAEQVALPVRLFRARLDKLEAALAAGQAAVVEGVVSDLRADLADMPTNNVIVLENRRDLDRVARDDFWQPPTALDLGYLRGKIAPLLRVRLCCDQAALGFELDTVEAGTWLIRLDEAKALVENHPEDRQAKKELRQAERAFEASQRTIVAQVNELPLTVNVVAAQLDTIKAIQTQHWWSTCTDAKLVDAADRLAGLMQYRQRRTEEMVHLHIQDAVEVRETVEFGPEHERLSTSAYREKVEAFVLSLVDENPVIQKLQAGEDLSPAEVRALADLLAAHDPYVTEDLLRKVYDHKTARFVQFIKHILGLEPLASWTETVTRAFDGFIAQHNTFSQMQIQFLQTLRTFILQTGKVEKRDLIDAPFTQIHPKGVRGVFQVGEIEEILAFTGQLVA